ncbi:MAG: SPOR domain-containing protein [Gemmatimonadetes bacterium]|nr:SPOR domain-containing protein [Gemmatimonadota bacterium]
MALSAASIGCGGPPSDQPDPLAGAELVSGTSLPRHGLLVLAHGGGVAEFRSAGDPSSVRWTGRIELPAATAAHPLGRSAVIRHADGASLYTPSPETLEPLPDVPASARWVPSGLGGAFIADAWAMIVTPSRWRVVTAAGTVLWAAPAIGGRAVALVETGGATALAAWDPEGDEPSTTLEIGTRGPIVAAAWGQQVVSTTPDGAAIRSWSVPGLEPTETIDIGAPPTLLAVSPSQHRVFAAAAGRPRVVSIDRYDWETVATSRFDEPLRALRPGATGEHLVVSDGRSAWTVRAGAEDRAAIPGEWRADLPLALPGGDVLVVDGAGLRRFAGDGSDLGAVEGPVDAWWTPLRWGPRAPVTAVALAPEDTLEQEPPAGASRTIGLLTMGTVAGQAASAPRPRDSEQADPDAGDAAPAVGLAAAPPLPGGFYAVANSSRSLESLGQLRRALDGSGYSTHVLPRVDEANETWYRLLVGPYRSRPAAEAAARELRRERGIDAWIHEVAGSEDHQ